MALESAIKRAEEIAEKNKEDFRLCPSQECDGTQDCRCLKNGEGKGCLRCAAEYRQLADWLKILKSAKFEYNEAWRIITHPTPDVTYADKQRAQVILDKFRNSLGAMK